MKLAEALLRRKELQGRLDRMGPIRQQDLYEVRVKRVQVTDSIDEVTAGVPKMTYAQFDQEYSHYAKQLRLIDAAIQRTNWTADVEVTGVWDDFVSLVADDGK